jgi:hypothetical protein
MTSTRSSKNSEQLIKDFSWDALPEVAKERWEEMVAYSSTVENQLSKAKASRAQAETERQHIASETLKATKEACRAVVADSKRAKTKLKAQVAEADENYAESRRQLEQALSIRNEADAYKENTIASGEKQAQELLRAATHAAEVECARLKKQASLEAYQLLAQAEAMRGAAQEELEAQKIYAEAAMLKADAHEALSELQARLEDSEDALDDAFTEEATSDEAKDEPNDGPVAEIKEILESVGHNPNGTNVCGNNGAVTTPLESPSSSDPQAGTDATSSKPRAKASRAKAA